MDIELEQVKELLHNSRWLCEKNLSIEEIYIFNFYFSNDFLHINSDSPRKYNLIQEDNATWIILHPPYGISDRLKIVQLEKTSMTLRQRDSIFEFRRIS